MMRVRLDLGLVPVAVDVRMIPTGVAVRVECRARDESPHEEDRERQRRQASQRGAGERHAQKPLTMQSRRRATL
jgi:hypothetical protein